MKKLLCICCISLLFLSACEYDETWKNIPINQHFTVDIPPFVKKVDDLRPGAPLQYSNRFRNFYIIGLEYEMNKNISLDSLQKQLIKPILSYVTHSTGPIPSGKSKISSSEKGVVVYQPRPSSQTIGGFRHSSIVVQMEKDGAKS